MVLVVVGGNIGEQPTIFVPQRGSAVLCSAFPRRSESEEAGVEKQAPNGRELEDAKDGTDGTSAVG